MKTNHLFGSILFWIVFGLYAFPAHAQTSCGGVSVSASCLKHPSQTYQCVSGNYNSPSLYGTALLSPAQALNTPQYLLVKGYITFTGDYTFAQGSNIVFLDNNSGFKVDAGAQLTLEKSDLNGCSQLWAGVEVLSGSSIKADRSNFQDAKAAIVLRDNVKVEITENSFTKNVCGILAVPVEANNSTTASVFLSSKNGITGNKFSGNEPLLQTSVPGTIVDGLFLDAPMQSTNYPFTGIWLERVNYLTIGRQGESINVFHDYGRVSEGIGIRTSGIRSVFSNVSVKNCKFDRIGYYIPDSQIGNIQIEGYAVFALNYGVTTKQTTVEGITPVATGVNVFFDCYRDIFTIGTDLVATQLLSYKAFESIVAQTAGPWQNPVKIEISKNHIKSFKEEGITLSYHRPITFFIEDNLIEDDDLVEDPVQRFGILLQALVPYEIPVINSRVVNNVIRSSSMPVNTTFFGIAIRLTSFFSIEQNKITDAITSGNLAAFYGIRGLQVPCSGLDIRYNTINGSGINYIFATGIDLRESVNSKVYCNFTDNINIGMLFMGNCGNLDLRRNDFMYHGVGLSVGSFHPFLSGFQYNQIGPQVNKENRWLGNNSLIEAFVLNEASALASRFWINSADINSVFWPFPRRIGPQNDNFFWFLPSTSGPPASGAECSIEGPLPPAPELTEADEQILNGVYQEPWGFAAMDWEARWHLADRIHRNAELTSANNSASTYYQNTNQENFSKFNKVYRSFLNRWYPDSPLSAQVESISAILTNSLIQRSALDAALSVNVNDNAALHQQMQVLDAAIAEWSDSLNALNTQIWAWAGQHTMELLTQVDNASSVTPYEADMKTVLRIILQTHFTDGEVNAVQKGELEAIAAKCRYSGGYAVVLARAFFEPQESYPQDVNCQIPRVQLEHLQQQSADMLSEVRVFPNPTGQFFTIQTPDLFERGTAKLYDLHSTLLQTLPLSGQYTSMHITHFEPGIYLLDVHLDDKPAVRKKIIIVR